MNSKCILSSWDLFGGFGFLALGFYLVLASRNHGFLCATAFLTFQSPQCNLVSVAMAPALRSPTEAPGRRWKAQVTPGSQAHIRLDPVAWLLSEPWLFGLAPFTFLASSQSCFQKPGPE